MKRIFRLALSIYLVALVISAITSFLKNDQWIGIAYPNKHDLTQHQVVGEFKSLEDCRDETLNLLRELSGDGSTSRSDYECGLNCHLKSGLNVCERTER